jgi:hypothetical protein
MILDFEKMIIMPESNLSQLNKRQSLEPSPMDNSEF